MSDAQQRIEAPGKLLDRLRPVQEQIDRMQAEIQAAIFGAALALDVPDNWQWNGTGWVSPEEAERERSEPPSS